MLKIHAILADNPTGYNSLSKLNRSINKKYVPILIICSKNSTMLTSKNFSLPHRYPLNGAYIPVNRIAGISSSNRIYAMFDSKYDTKKDFPISILIIQNSTNARLIIKPLHTLPLDLLLQEVFQSLK